MNFTFASLVSRSAIARFEKQYSDGRYPQHKQTLDKLLALPPEQQTPDNIAKLIGNKGWTHPHCVECGAYPDVAVEMGNPDYDQSVTLCLPCLKSAVAGVQAATSALNTLGAELASNPA